LNATTKKAAQSKASKNTASKHKVSKKKSALEKDSKKATPTVENREAQSAKDIAANVQQKTETKALAVKRVADHRRAQISRNEAEKGKQSAIVKKLPTKTFAEAVQTSSTCASSAVLPTTPSAASSTPGKVTIRHTETATLAPTFAEAMQTSSTCTSSTVSPEKLKAEKE
jgi:hypothetical protein